MLGQRPFTSALRKQGCPARVLAPQRKRCGCKSGLLDCRIGTGSAGVLRGLELLKALIGKLIGGLGKCLGHELGPVGPQRIRATAAVE